MSRLFRYLCLALLAGHLALLAQQTEPPVAEPAPPALPALTAEVPEAPPAEPVEPPAKKAPRRARNPVRRDQHPNAIFGQNIVVKKGETIHDLVLIGGTAEIEGTVERDVVVIGGALKLTGTVEGELVLIGSAFDCAGTVRRHAKVIMGKATLGNTAQLDRGALFIGGPFKISPDASIMGERLLFPLGDVLPKVNGLKAWLVNGLLWGRLLPIGVYWVWVVAGFFVGLYFLALLLFPAAIKAIFLSLEERPVTSVLAGFLALILFAPLIALLLASIVGIPVVPFLQVALVLAILFGKAAVMCFLGRSFGRSTGVAFLQVPLMAFLVGATLLVLAYMIPVFGMLAWILATVFGLGGAVVALARLFQQEEANVPPAPVLVGSRSGGASAPGIAPPTFDGPPLTTSDTLLRPRAGFWKRLLASLLDFVLLGLFAPVVGKAAFLPLVVFYFVALWTWKGTTVGSLLLRLRVVRTDGAPVTFSVALVRSLSSFFSLFVLGFGFFWCGWDREKQSWHDKIAGTVVVQMPKGFALL